MRVRNRRPIRFRKIASSVVKEPLQNQRAFMFLIPEYLFRHFQFLKKNRTCSQVLLELLNRYYESVFSGGLWFNERTSKQYQEVGLDLMGWGEKVEEAGWVRSLTSPPPPLPLPIPKIQT